MSHLVLVVCSPITVESRMIFSIYAIYHRIIYKTLEGWKTGAAMGTSHKYSLTIKCPWVSKHRQLLTETFELCAEQGAVRTLTQESPQTEAGCLQRPSPIEPRHPCKESVAAGLISQLVCCRMQGGAVPRKTCCCWSNHVKNESGIECHKLPPLARCQPQGL